MSPRQARRGTIRHSVRIRAKEKETTLPEEVHAKPKNEHSVRKRHTRKTKDIQSIEHEQESTFEEVEKEKPRSKKSRAQKSRKKVTVNKSNAVLSSNSEDDNYVTSMHTDARAQMSKLRRSQENVINNDTLKSSDLTFTPERLSPVQADSKHTPTPKITPKINPVAVNLTPLRTSKTPKKSPANPSSPKTHSKTPLRWSKTPRKLTITDNSPVSSDKSNTPSVENTSRENNKRLSDNISMDTTVSQVSSRVKKKQKPMSIRTVQSVRRFSKSPKIVLRSPRSKSRKSKSPKAAIRSTSKASLDKKSAEEKKISLLTPSKYRSNPCMTIKSESETLKKLSPLQMTAVLNQPRVVLEKLKSLNDPASASKIKRPSINENDSDETVKTPVVQMLAYEVESPKKPKSASKKRSLVIDSETPLRPRSSPRTMGLKKDVQNESSKSKDSISAENISQVISGPEMSSTPHERIRRPVNLNTSFDLKESPSVSTSPTMTRSRNEISSKVCKTPCIADISEPSMEVTDSSISGNAVKNNTYEITKEGSSVEEQNEGSVKNDTYEVLEPKTPSLQKKSRKRSSEAANLSSDRAQTKRVCKVRFASPVPESDDSIIKAASAITKLRSSTPAKRRVHTKIDVSDSKAKHYVEKKLNKSTSTPNTMFRKRSSSISDVHGQKSVSAVIQNKQKSRSLSRVNVKVASAKKQQETPRNKSFNKSNHSILSETKALKTPVARKAPNFAQIHQKKFAEMESVVDAKNRLEKRHIAMTSGKPRPKPVLEGKKQAMPSETVNGVYNRFGYKIKKDDARDIVLKKQPTVTKKSKQEENRAILKGVRMNRRFELQMKSRNINL